MKNLIRFLLVLPLTAFGQNALTTAQIAKRVSPSVVVIQGKTDSGDALGSGFIISKDGKIVTNLHVIRDMKTASIQLATGEVFDSISVLATDERRDLAIVKAAGFDLPTLDLGNSDALAAGEPVVIVGSPGGLEGTITAGILSSVRDSGGGFKVLQTDAAVNPGNSGGPLVNNKAQAIGVVSFKLRSTEGLNFAVPINYVRGMLNSLHEPISLEQMQRSLAAAASAVQHNGGPSLKETLDWLKEKLPLAANHYTLPAAPFSENLGTQDVTLRTVPTAFESCTVSFDFIETRRSEKYRDFPRAKTTRQTIPLGALTNVTISRDYVNKINNTIEAWWVLLSATSKVILSEDHDTLGDTIQSQSVDYAFLVFSEESIARRVLDAFNHAAELCRGKEPF